MRGAAKRAKNKTQRGLKGAAKIGVRHSIACIRDAYSGYKACSENTSGAATGGMAPVAILL